MTKEIEEARARLQEIQNRCLLERDRMKGVRVRSVSQARKAIRKLRNDAGNLRSRLRKGAIAPERLTEEMAAMERQYDETIGREARDPQGTLS